MLLPAVLSRRKLPVNLREDELMLFSDEIERLIPAVNLQEIGNVRISPDGLLFKRGQILSESFAFPSLQDEWKKRSVVKLLVRNYILRKTRLIEDDAVWIVDTWSKGYFHWLSDALCKLFLIRELLNERTLLLPHQYQGLDFVWGSLKAFAVKDVRFTDANEVLRCDKLVLPAPVAPSGHFRDEIIQGVRHQLTSYYSANAPSTPDGRIYISRERAPKRKLSNEAEILDVLRGFRFEVIHAEDLLFVDQIRIFSQTRYLISNHGAGLTNMLFMNTGARVLELRHETDRVNNCYFTMSSALNLDYFYQTCEPTNSGEDAHTANLVVDAERLEKNLRIMLKD